MYEDYLFIEFSLWALHPKETRATEEDYNEALNTAIVSLANIECEEAKSLSVALPLLLKQGDKERVYKTLSRFVEKELYPFYAKQHKL